MTDMIYGITDTPRKVREWILYALQQVLAVFVATVLIANICGTPVDACLLGACFGTLLYQLITKFRSPMFISSCGATVSAVIGALAIGETKNYLLVVIGGLVILAIYSIVSIIVKKCGIETLNKILPAIIIGPVTMVIGLNLATFIPTYLQVNGQHSNIGIAVGFIVMLFIAIVSHYFKGFWKTIPFLMGLILGYVICIILTITHVAPLVDFSIFKNMTLFALPDFTFKYWNFNIGFGEIGQVILLFAPVALAAVCEHWADHRTLSNIVGVDLTKDPGLHRTLLGDGAASALGTIICGLPNTSYGESIATTGFSKVASTKVISVSAAILGVLAFIRPFQCVIASIPSCVFGGCAMILYGYIAASGLKALINSKADLEDNKNLIIVAVVLTIGVGGIWWFHQSFAGVSLAMITGIILNLILRVKPNGTK